MEYYRANPNSESKDALQFRERVREELMERNPYIDWYRIYPENGKVEKLSEPPEGGTQFRKEYGAWRPMPDGSIKKSNYFGELLDKYAQESKQTDQESDRDDKREADQAVSLTQKTDAPPIQGLK